MECYYYWHHLQTHPSNLVCPLSPTIILQLGFWLLSSLSQSHSVVVPCIQKKISHCLDVEVGLPFYISHFLLLTGFKQAFYTPDLLTILSACPKVPQMFPSALTAPSRFSFLPFPYLVSWSSNNQSVRAHIRSPIFHDTQILAFSFFSSFYHLFSLQRPLYSWL